VELAQAGFARDLDTPPDGRMAVVQCDFDLIDLDVLFGHFARSHWQDQNTLKADGITFGPATVVGESITEK
jgi:hypothetical protein